MMQNLAIALNYNEFRLLTRKDNIDYTYCFDSESIKGEQNCALFLIGRWWLKNWDWSWVFEYCKEHGIVVVDKDDAQEYKWI